MARNDRLQILVTEKEARSIRKAAKIYKLSASEWARRVLCKAAERDLSSSTILDPLDAVKKLSRLNAPVDTVENMKKESIE